jgi:DNA transposition AAA+ family ATPase
MKRLFIRSANAWKFLDGYQKLEQRGAAEACLMIVDGEPGTSKTTVTQWWAVQHQAVFLRAKREWTPAWMMRELLGALRKTPEYSFEKMFRQALQALGDGAEAAARDGQPYAVVIDEVDHVVKNARIMETFRDLSDMLEIPFVLVGMGLVAQQIRKMRQVARRVAQHVEFERATPEDTAAMVSGRCEVPVRPDLVDFLHTASQGLFSEMLEGIASIERFGRRNPGTEIGCAEMDGQVLLYDRATGKPILVRA